MYSRRNKSKPSSALRAVPVLPFAILLPSGIIIGDRFGPIDFRFWFTAAAVVLVFAAVYLRSPRSNAGLYFLFFLIGIGGGNRTREALQTAEHLPPGETIWGGKIAERIQRADHRDVYRFRVDWVSRNGVDFSRFPGDLRLITSGGNPDYEPGSRIVVYGEVAPYPIKRNPGSRDLKLEYARRGIVGWIKPTTVVLTGETGRRLRPRKALENAVTADLPPPQARLLTGMLLGDKSVLSEDVRNAFQSSGLYHLLAVSGLHIGYLFAVLLLLSRILFKNLNLRRWMMFSGLWGYVFLTGGKPPTVRAALMISLLLLSYFLRRIPRPWNLWSAAALLILLFDPGQLFAPGFQLSFAAMAGVLTALDFNNRLTHRKPNTAKGHHRWKRALNNLIFIPLLISFGVSVFTAPLLIYHFGGFAPVAILLNLVAIPLAGALFGLSWVMIFFTLLTNTGLSPLSGVIELGLKGLSSLAAYGSQLPGNSASDYGGFWQTMIFSGIILGLFLIPTLKRKVLWAAGGSLILVFTPILTPSPYLRIEFLDVGQGEATLLRFPNGSTLLVDSGDEKAARFELIPCFTRRGIKQVDNLILTHFDRDHASGAFALMDRMRIKRLFTSSKDTDDPLGDSLLSKASSKGIEVRALALGDTLLPDPGSKCLILWPPQAESGSDNRHSIVAKIAYGKVGILLTGDIGSDEERILQAGGEILKADILKVAHHGSRYSSSRSFLEMVQPEMALIGCGERNRYGHPAPRVVGDLEKLGAKVHRTDLDQAGVYASDGKTLWEVDWR
jgi:competence protein ComEC